MYIIIILSYKIKSRVRREVVRERVFITGLYDKLFRIIKLCGYSENIEVSTWI